jgi:hypothetical protein
MIAFFDNGSLPRGPFSPYAGWSPHNALIAQRIVTWLSVAIAATLVASSLRLAINASRARKSWKYVGRRRTNDTGAMIPSISAEAEAPVLTSHVGSGYALLKVTFGIIIGCLFMWLITMGYLNRHEIAAHPEQLERVVVSLLCMLFGVMADLVLGFSDSGRELSTIKLPEVLAPLMVSAIIFLGIWSSVLSSGSTFSAAYTSIASGFAWRRVIGSIQKQFDGAAS